LRLVYDKYHLCKKAKDFIPRGLKNHADGFKSSVWFFNPCVILFGFDVSILKIEKRRGKSKGKNKKPILELYE